MAYMIAHKIDGTVRRDERLVPRAERAWIGNFVRAIGFNPRAFVIRDPMPPDVDRFLQLAAVTWMQALDGAAGLGKLPLQAQLVELRGRVESVAAYQDPSGRKQAGRGEPDRAASSVQELQAAIDVVVLLPEAPALPCNFVSRCICAFSDDFLKVLAEVIRYLLQHHKRHSADAIIGVDGLRSASVRVAYADPVGGLSNLRHRGGKLDRIAQGLGEGIRNPVHAANWLEHRGLHFEGLFKQDSVPEVFVEQRMHVDRLAQDAVLIPGPGRLHVSCILASAVFACFVKGAVDAQKTQDRKS